LAYNVDALQFFDEVVKRGWHCDAVNFAGLVRQVRQIFDTDALG
jgi:hypothetical protein